MPCCCVKNCLSKSRGPNPLKFHRFPVSDKELLNVWLERIGDPVLQSMDPILYTKKRICHLHFHEMCILPTRRGLKDNSIPVLHLPVALEPTRENCFLVGHPIIDRPEDDPLVIKNFEPICEPYLDHKYCMGNQSKMSSEEIINFVNSKTQIEQENPQTTYEAEPSQPAASPDLCSSISHDVPQPMSTAGEEYYLTKLAHARQKERHITEQREAERAYHKEKMVTEILRQQHLRQQIEALMLQQKRETELHKMKMLLLNKQLES